MFYPVAKGGEAAAGKRRGDDPALVPLAVLGSSPPETVTVNELTTVASAFTAARFIDGEATSGNLLGLRIAAGNVPIYQYPVRAAEAALAQAKPNVPMLKAQLDAAGPAVEQARAVRDFATDQLGRSSTLSRERAASVEQAQRWQDRCLTVVFGVLAAEAEAELQRAQLSHDSRIDGVNTAVAAAPPALFAVKITLDAPELREMPIGAHGAAAICTAAGGISCLRRVVIRAYTWLNWLQSLPS